MKFTSALRAIGTARLGRLHSGRLEMLSVAMLRMPWSIAPRSARGRISGRQVVSISQASASGAQQPKSPRTGPPIDARSAKKATLRRMGTTSSGFPAMGLCGWQKAWVSSSSSSATTGKVHPSVMRNSLRTCAFCGSSGKRRSGFSTLCSRSLKKRFTTGLFS